MVEKQQTICLCMIVKNESHVITRCLASVRPLIDSWVIVDTGSSDGTQQIIREYLHDIPGELAERPWVDFAHNRSEALALARGRAEYVLIIDADEVLELDPDFTMPVLAADSYLFPMSSGGLAYYKTQLVRDALDWRFIGVVHEYIFADGAVTHLLMDGLKTLRIPDGARSRDPLTYRRDALLLEGALLQEPENTRHMFYLAQSYADANEPLAAIDRYTKRVAMGGWAEEVWYSLCRIAVLKQQLNAGWPEVMSAYLAAYNVHPKRAEPLFHIGYFYQVQKQYALAHLFFEQAMAIPFPRTDLLYVEQQVYDFLLPIEYAVACFYVGRHREAIETANRLLQNRTLTSELVDKVILNRSFSLEALFPRRTVEVARSSRIIACILLDESDSLTAACLKSLRAQEHKDLRVVVVQNGAASDAQETLAEEAMFAFKRSPERLSWAACLRLAADDARADDILFLMQGSDRLLNAASLGHVASHFESYDCGLMYGQFRWSDGSRGNAAPLASQQELQDGNEDSGQDGKERSLVPLAVRCSLLREAGLTDAATPFDLLRSAGFKRIRFNDEVLLVRDTSNRAG